MPITNAFWTKGAEGDRHVLRGGQASPNLAATALAYSSAAGNQFAAVYAGGDVALTFTPLFKGVPNGDLHEGHGIHFNVRTGVCTVDAAVPPQAVNNFIVEAVAAPNPPGGATFTQRIRFHIHTSIVRAWLTPSPMTVRPVGPPPHAISTYRFAVRAEFNDDTVGDLTLNHGVTWTPANLFGAGGKIVLRAGDAVGSDIDVTASIPAAAGPVNAIGRVHVGELWANEPNPPKVSIVPGGGWPGTINPEKVPNVLFLGDGFTASATDKDAFQGMTNSFVQHMKTDALMRPFDVLATSINFWRAFVAGPSGISVRSEVFTFTRGADTFAQAFEIVRPPPAAGAWDMSNMLYAVGLPVPGDRTVGNPQLQARWAATLTTDPTPQLSIDLIDRWKGMGDRAFLDEIDSFPAMSYGEPPAANAGDNYILNLHPDRGGVDSLRPLYRVISSDSGVALSGNRPLGLVWAEKPPDVHFDNTDLVVLMSSFPGGRAQNGTGYIAISSKTANAELRVTRVAGRKSFTLVPPATPTEVSADSCRTMTHEMAHSFGVGDEYADRVGVFAPQNDLLPTHANLQTEQNVKDAAGKFVGNQIKWNWHRIKKAAVIEAAPTGPAGGPFTIPLRLGEGLQFAVGDPVLLRLRTRGVALTASPQVLTPNQELRVTVHAPDSVTVAPVIAGAVTLAQVQQFLPGSIVFIPTPAPASVRTAAYPYAEIVALNVKNAITTQNRPLTAVPCDMTTVGPSVQSPKLDGIDLPGLCFAHKPRIIGLYEGGRLVSCGVFHPSGMCMMRQNHDESAQFCHVCRYVIVDFVDPGKHFQIDLDYGRVYAQG